MIEDGLSARRAAAEAWLAVRQHRKTLETALEHVSGFSDMSDRDRAFARAIAATTFRRQGQTEAVLAKFLSKPLHETSDGARALLLTGATQLLWMDVPAHAVVSSTVELAGRRRDAAKLKGLINAVLRKVDKEGREHVKATAPRDNLPDWLRTSWRSAYGPGGLSRIANVQLDAPPLDLTVKDPTTRQHWAEALGAEIMPNGTLRLASARDVRQLPGYDDGAWWAQDAAASIPATLLGVVPGQSVIDLCAAPGGKTLQLAAMGAKVTAVDNSDKRLDRLRENLARTGLEAEIVVSDARRYRPQTLADNVLLDAPCTATGTLRRHPEAVALKKPQDVKVLQKLQLEMASAATRMLRPGGTLVLCTCSLQPEEGEELAGQLTAQRRDLKPVAIQDGECPGFESAITRQGWLRLTPGLWADKGGMDGFFIARFEKRL
ncbi:RsmB/NOP family class I SAM-dependent RNA methyltransferase [Maricaulis sp. CAU 1757]